MMMRLVGTIMLVYAVSLMTVGLAAATPIGQATVLDGAAFVDKWTGEVADYYNRQINQLNQQQQELIEQRDRVDDTHREQLDRQIENLRAQVDEMMVSKERWSGSDAGWEVFRAARGIHQTLMEIEDGLNQVDTWDRQIVWLDRIAAEQMAQARHTIKQIDRVGDYGTRLATLLNLLEKLGNDAPTPANQRMLDGVRVLFDAMDGLGKDIPIVGDFIGTYGNVSGALIDAIERIDQKLSDTEMENMMYLRAGDPRMSTFKNQFPELARRLDGTDLRPISGLRDAFVVPHRGVFIWDPDLGRWQNPRDITAEELLRRYAFMATYGNPNPKLGDVLQPLNRIVGIRLTPADTVVEPGGRTTISVTAEYADREDALALLVNLSSREEASLTGWLGLGGGGGRLEPRVVEPPATVVFTAPDTENYVYRISAEITYDPRAGHMTLVGSPSCIVATGIESRLELSANPPKVNPGGDGVIRFRVTDRDGNVLPVRGNVSFLSDRIQTGEIKMAREGGFVAYHAPPDLPPGRYKVVARFNGSVDATFWSGSNVMMVESEIFISVKDEDGSEEQGLPSKDSSIRAVDAAIASALVARTACDREQMERHVSSAKFLLGQLGDPSMAGIQSRQKIMTRIVDSYRDVCDPVKLPDRAYAVLRISGAGYVPHWAGGSYVYNGYEDRLITLRRGQSLTEAVEDYRSRLGNRCHVDDPPTVGGFRNRTPWFWESGPRIGIKQAPTTDRDAVDPQELLRLVPQVIANWETEGRDGPSMSELKRRFCGD
ncbi:hypothetical protein [Desulfobulbus alkaliphilus]|uniref:hypothetical protein n=1 Tax=Desulfobulbus alkaliphilus TaxID=869814 RepID=UPI0019661C92|nr:hypothetical protein [Desulfobulbus alkaliphilus]MBM9538727.1 hypothetical protein [Desulfobulbus alkaliphilus]